MNHAVSMIPEHVAKLERQFTEVEAAHEVAA
jgi:hypothetical protein